MSATLFLAAVIFLLAGCAGRPDAPQPRLPAVKASGLVADGHIAFAPIKESSGLVQSRQYPGVFWTHNDSGDSPRLFAIRADGSLVRPADGQPYEGIRVQGAKNRDWEDIALLDTAALLICDLGNNANKRRDLTLYRVPEPNPFTDRSVTVESACQVFYPEQTAFPPAQNNFDCEAVFPWGDRTCFLTKNRADAMSSLYLMPSWPSGALPQRIPLELGKTYDFDGKATAADSLDGRIAVLTSHSVWIFEPEVPAGKSKGEPELFSGSVWWKPIHAGQCESIAFIDRDSVLIGNEQRDLYRLDLGKFYRIQ